MSEQKTEQQWGSTFGFIVSTIGYSVGLGAIWKFPYMIGMNGGGIFLLLCIIFMLIIAVPLAWVELTLGRYTRCSAITGMRKLEGNGTKWTLIGYFGFATCFTLTAYYITIIADVFYYLFKFVSGGLSGLSVGEMADFYTSVSVNMPLKFGWTALTVVILIAVILRGVQKGLEAANKIMIPGLFIFLAILAIRGIMLPGGIDGVVWLFSPDMSKLTPSVMFAALNQSFFMAGVGFATMFSFGSYLDAKESDIPFNGTIIILSNIVVAVLAGLAIFPSLFAYNMDIASGSGLTFMTLPYVFDQMPMGIVWGGLFFLLLLFAGFSTILGLTEGQVSTIADAFNWNRKKVTVVIGIALFICSTPAILSTTVWKNVTPLNMDLFTFMDFLAMGIFCPIAVILTAIYGI